MTLSGRNKIFPIQNTVWKWIPFFQSCQFHCWNRRSPFFKTKQKLIVSDTRIDCMNVDKSFLGYDCILFAIFQINDDLIICRVVSFDRCDDGLMMNLMD